MEKEIKRIYASADYTGLSEAERRIFKATVEELSSRGILRFTDSSVIASYSRNVLLARLASKDVQKYGILLKQSDNYHQGEILKENPAINVMQRAQAAYEKSATQLGLTPTGRRRMKGEEVIKSAADEWEEENG